MTTVDPGAAGLRKSSSTDVNYGIRTCIGGSSQDWCAPLPGWSSALGVPSRQPPADDTPAHLPPPCRYGANAGGVAYIGSFSWGSDEPAYVFTQQLGPNHPKYVWPRSSSFP